jgi:hypothetical protein
LDCYLSAICYSLYDLRHDQTSQSLKFLSEGSYNHQSQRSPLFSIPKQLPIINKTVSYTYTGRVNYRNSFLSNLSFHPRLPQTTTGSKGCVSQCHSTSELFTYSKTTHSALIKEKVDLNSAAAQVLECFFHTIAQYCEFNTVSK